MKTPPRLKTAFVMAAMALLVLLCCPPSAAADAQPAAEQLFADANRLYAEENYEQALKLYQQVRARGLTAPELLFNMGNACFKLGHIGRARVFYERALSSRIRGDDDLRLNLAFLRSMLKDPEQEPKDPPHLAVARKLESGTWLFLGLVFYALAFALATAAALRGGRLTAGFRVGVAVCACAGLACAAGLAVLHVSGPLRHAAIVVPQAEVMHTPSYTGKVFFTLHDGTLVRLLQKDGNWAFVQYGDDKRGWVENADVEEI